MRKFPYWTVGRIINEVNRYVETQPGATKMSRRTFYKLEDSGLFESKRTINNWRRYSNDEAQIIIDKIKANYAL